MTALIIRMAPASNDKRRTITEAETPAETGFGIARITSLNIHPVPGQGPAELGIHYHRQDRERFTLALGIGVLVTQDVDPETGQLIGRHSIDAVSAGDVIVMEPYTAHTFYFDRPALMTCASTHPFDSGDMPRIELYRPDAGFRAMLILRAMANASTAHRWDEIFYEFDGKMRVMLITEGPAVVIDGGNSINITEDNLGQVMEQVRVAVSR